MKRGDEEDEKKKKKQKEEEGRSETHLGEPKLFLNMDTFSLGTKQSP